MILSLSTDKDNLLPYKNEGILPSVAVYGANAASISRILNGKKICGNICVLPFFLSMAYYT